MRNKSNFNKSLQIYCLKNMLILIDLANQNESTIVIIFLYFRFYPFNDWKAIAFASTNF